MRDGLFFRKLWGKTGPGLLFAASSIGVSHLVQSTRSGGTYALTFTIVIIGSCLIKYPVFRFGSDYASATGRSLIHGYREQGKWAIALMVVALLVDMFIATAAVVLVTAGLFRQIIHFEIGIVPVAFGLLFLCATMLITGRYQLFESISKFFVVVMALLTTVAAGFAVTRMGMTETYYFPAVGIDHSSILFTIAVAGWMPTSVSASVFLSVWICARADTLKQSLTPQEARFDFHVGYFATVALAMCFLLLGAALFYGKDILFAEKAADFAGQIIGLFTEVFGSWAYYGVAIIASVVMLSTLLSLLDGPPRTLASILRPNRPTKDLMAPLIIVQVVGTTAILVFFVRSFTAFIDFAASTAFLTAPILAYLNHRCMLSVEVPAELRPSIWIQLWSISGIIFFILFCGAFLLYRFTGV